MPNACIPILVGVASPVLEIWLFSFLCQICSFGYWIFIIINISNNNNDVLIH